MNGLGDLVAVVLHSLGITQKPDCGCAARQAALNKLVPFKVVKGETVKTSSKPD